MKVLVALKVPGADLSEIIQAHRRYLVELMQQWTHIKEDGDPADLNSGLAIDAELFRLDSAVRWLDAAEARIKRAKADAESPFANRATPASDSRDDEVPGPNGLWPPPRLRGNARNEVKEVKEVRTGR
jgi:hypothetical protein